MGTNYLLSVGFSYVLCPKAYSFLEAAPRSARKLKKFLMYHYNFLDQNCKVVNDEEGTPTATDIINHLTSMIEKSSSGDQLVFYFCGHGGREPSIDNNSSGFVEYLCCGPLFGNTKRQTHIEDYTLSYIVKSIPEDRHITLIMDCCSSGGIVEGADEIVGSSNKNPIKDRGSEGPKSPFLNIGESCRKSLGIVFTACHSGELTFGDKWVAYFTESFMKAAIEGGRKISNLNLILATKRILHEEFNGLLPHDPKRKPQLTSLYAETSQKNLRFLSTELGD